MTTSSPMHVSAGRLRFSSGGYFFILLGVIAMSASPIIIRYGLYAGAPSLLISAGRMVVAALILTPLALRGHGAELRRLSRGDLLLAAISGMVLALHFATWIASLEYTSVLISVILVTTSTLWVAVLEMLFLRARPQRIVVLAILLTIGGGIIIGAGGSSEAAGSAPLLGAGLSLTGALAFAVYLVIGRKLRRTLTLVPQIWLVYSFAAITLALTVAAVGMPVTGYAPEAYGYIVVLALVPQLIGHTSLNYALRYISATYVSIITQLEPVGAAVAAFILFAEQPTWSQIGGSAAILVGVLIASVAQTRPAKMSSPAAIAEETEAESLVL